MLSFMEPSAFFLDVRSIVNGEDPVGLLDMGAPEDEYDIEVKDLIKLTRLNSAPLTAKQVSVIFLYWFGEPGEMPADMAERIADGVNQARAQHAQT